MAAAQAGQSAGPKTAAALTFALKAVKQPPLVNEEKFAQFRSAGFEDEHFVEILAHVALNIFTNCINIALDVALDFPALALNPV